MNEQKKVQKINTNRQVKVAEKIIYKKNILLFQSVHIVDNRTIRVSLTQTSKNDYKPKNPKNYEETIELIHEVGFLILFRVIKLIVFHFLIENNY